MIFVDTSAWIAFANELDIFHEHANPLMRDLIKDSSVQLFTSDIILGEILDLVSHDTYRKRLMNKSGLSEGDIKHKCETIREMLDRMIQDSAKAELLHADEEIIANTKILYRDNPQIYLNFSDWSNISFMKRYNIKKLFTYEKSFGYTFNKGFGDTTEFETIPRYDELKNLIKSIPLEYQEKQTEQEGGTKKNKTDDTSHIPTQTSAK